MKWTTRERPKIDRIARPWLIARFIDPEPEFLFVPSGDVLRVAAAAGPHPSPLASRPSLLTYVSSIAGSRGRWLTSPQDSTVQRLLRWRSMLTDALKIGKSRGALSGIPVAWR